MKYFNRVNNNEVNQIMSWEGLVPCGPCWGKGSSLAQSWGRCFLPTASVGLGDCTAAQENIWAPPASCCPFGWIWKCTGALQLTVCLISPITCEIRASGCSAAALGRPRLQRWRRLPLFCVAALIPGYRQPLLCITGLDKGRMPPARHGGSAAPYGHNGASLQ